MIFSKGSSVLGSGVVGSGVAYVPSTAGGSPPSPNDGRAAIVRPAVENHVEEWYHRPHQSSGHIRLWVSDMTGCARKVCLRMREAAQEIEPPSRNKLAMRSGVFYEAETAKALKAMYGETAVVEQLSLRNHEWSGKPDFVLWHQTATAVLIEHKATNSQWWNYKDSLPQESHVAQLWLYGELYREQYGIVPKLILFYRAWGHYAEYELLERMGDVWAVGEIDGFSTEQVLGPVSDLVAERQRLEAAFTQEFSAPHQAPLPERLSLKDDGCSWRGRPDCPYYYQCWGDGERNNA